MSYKFEITKHTQADIELGTAPKDKPWGLFCRYLPNPLASCWAFTQTEGDAIRLRDKLCRDLDKKGVSYEI
jgi:hypothetical protein